MTIISLKASISIHVYMCMVLFLQRTLVNTKRDKWKLPNKIKAQREKEWNKGNRTEYLNFVEKSNKGCNINDLNPRRKRPIRWNMGGNSD